MNDFDGKIHFPTHEIGFGKLRSGHTLFITHIMFEQYVLFTHPTFLLSSSNGERESNEIVL
jgi:hypothetical protein